MADGVWVGEVWLMGVGGRGVADGVWVGEVWLMVCGWERCS